MRRFCLMMAIGAALSGSIGLAQQPPSAGPYKVLKTVKVGGAGLCRTDLHIQEGQWAEKSGVELPYVLGHENAGWVSEIGSAVSNVEVGDTVIVHPLITCGLCRACRAGDDVHCENNLFPGISVDGGFAELLKTSARSVVKLDPTLHPLGERVAGALYISAGEPICSIRPRFITATWSEIESASSWSCVT